MARVCDAARDWECVAVRVGSFICQRHHLTAPIRFKRGFGSEGSNENRPSLTPVRYAPFQCVRWMKFFAGRSGMVSPLLTTDDVVRCRTVTSPWNVGNRFGEMGEFYFLLLRNDPHEKHWHYDSDGNKTYMMLKKNDALMEGIRKWELHDPKEAASSSGEKQWKHPLSGTR